MEHCEKCGQIIKNNGEHTCPTSTWNKGTKGIMKSNKTSFKKGAIPWIKGRKLPYKARPKMSGRPAWNSGKKQIQTTGEKNPNWNGGITEINHKIRTSLEMKLWRKSIFERDNFTCQKCGKSGGKLNAHHIFNFADYPELRLAIDNGITLSKKAHKEFHHIYGNKNNTKEQLIEFLNN